VRTARADDGTWRDGQLGVDRRLFVSLLSLGVSVFIAVRVQSLVARIAFFSRADEVLSEIRQAVASLNDGMAAFPADERRTVSEMRKCLAKVYRVAQATSPRTRAVARRLRKLEDEYVAAVLDHDTLWSVEQRERILWELFTQLSIFLDHAEAEIADRRALGIDHG
jgi:hypothetical protein